MNETKCCPWCGKPTVTRETSVGWWENDNPELLEVE